MKFRIQKRKALLLLGAILFFTFLTTQYSAAAGPSNGPIGDLYEKMNALQQQVIVLQNRVDELENNSTPVPTVTPTPTRTPTPSLTPTPTIYACNPTGYEVCNGIDDDCDGSVDEAVLQNGQACGGTGTQGIYVCTNGTLECIMY